MTRIVSFSLYECPMCKQIHIKPEYGSISIYIPPDLSIEPTDTKVCRGCMNQIKFEDFRYLGIRSKTTTKQPTKLELLIRKLLKKPYVELDVRKLYPKFD
jgi:hypothetical protein